MSSGPYNCNSPYNQSQAINNGPEGLKIQASDFLSQYFPLEFLNSFGIACEVNPSFGSVVERLFNNNNYLSLLFKKDGGPADIPPEEVKQGVEQLRKHSDAVGYISKQVFGFLQDEVLSYFKNANIKPYEVFDPGIIHDVGKLAPGVFRVLVLNKINDSEDLEIAKKLHVILGACMVVEHYMIYHRLSVENLKNKDISDLSHPLATVLIHHLFTHGYPQRNELPKFPGPIDNLISQIFETAKIFIQNKNEPIIESIKKAIDKGKDPNVILAVTWALVVCASDLYVSLKEPRSYRKGMSDKEVKENFNKHFNNESFSQVFDALSQVVGLIPPNSEYSYLRISDFKSIR